MTITASLAAAWVYSDAFGASISTASFSVSVGDLLVAVADAAGPITISDSQSGSWNTALSLFSGSFKAVWRVISSAGSMTVTFDDTTDTYVAGSVLKYVGAKNSSPIGQTGNGSSTTNNITPTIFTSTADNSYAAVMGADFNALGTITSSDLTIQTSNQIPASYASGYKSLGTAGSETANLNAAGTGAADWQWLAVEILDGGKAPPNFGQAHPQRIWRGRRR